MSCGAPLPEAHGAAADRRQLTVMLCAMRELGRTSDAGHGVQAPTGAEDLLVLEHAPWTLRIGLGVALPAAAGMVAAGALQRKRKGS